MPSALQKKESGTVLLWLMVVAGALYGWAVFVSTFFAPGRIGINYDAPGTDWMAIYSAAWLTAHHELSPLLNGTSFTAEVNAHFAGILSEPMNYRPFVYPPAFLLVILPFGWLGFWVSYALMQLGSAALLAAGLRQRLAILAALLGPAASINAVDGQLSFLVAGLLAAGMRLILTGNSWAGGAVLGLLVIKPQFAVAVPFALAGLRDWRAVLGAGVCVAALVAGSLVAFGPGLWGWWFALTHQSVTDSSATWVQLARIWGCSIYASTAFTPLAPFGSVLQWAGTLFAGLCVFAAFRGDRPAADRLAVLLVGAMLAAPHSGPYDEVLLAAGGAIWLAAGQELRMKAVLLVATLCLAPLIGPPAAVPVGRVLPVLEIVFLVVVLRGAGLTARPDAPL